MLSSKSCPPIRLTLKRQRGLLGIVLTWFWSPANYHKGFWPFQATHGDLANQWKGIGKWHCEGPCNDLKWWRVIMDNNFLGILHAQACPGFNVGNSTKWFHLPFLIYSLSDGFWGDLIDSARSGLACRRWEGWSQLRGKLFLAHCILHCCLGLFHLI